MVSGTLALSLDWPSALQRQHDTTTTTTTTAAAAAAAAARDARV